ncbi:MAG: DNA oxidative demethylase AlkB [Granulosicoccus sp.]|nr:DNA oxidative demethylase AlkB [Granulosicoccus sp.]
MSDLFAKDSIEVCPGMWFLPEFASPEALLPGIDTVCRLAPLRHMTTPGGFRMSVGMTNCGRYGWVSDRRGYRYDTADPESGEPWPAMPEVFARLASKAADAAGYSDFEPDACLINRYLPGAGMTAHQDCNEDDFSQPIVSVSLGIPARFFIQGAERRGRSIPLDLNSGDVVVWGGPSRLFYHGIRPLKDNVDADFGRCRYNLTFRRAW